MKVIGAYITATSFGKYGARGASSVEEGRRGVLLLESNQSVQMRQPVHVTRNGGQER